MTVGLTAQLTLAFVHTAVTDIQHDMFPSIDEKHNLTNQDSIHSVVAEGVDCSQNIKDDKNKSASEDDILGLLESSKLYGTNAASCTTGDLTPNTELNRKNVSAKISTGSIDPVALPILRNQQQQHFPCPQNKRRHRHKVRFTGSTAQDNLVTFPFCEKNRSKQSWGGNEDEILTRRNEETSKVKERNHFSEPNATKTEKLMDQSNQNGDPLFKMPSEIFDVSNWLQTTKTEIIAANVSSIQANDANRSILLDVVKSLNDVVERLKSKTLLEREKLDEERRRLGFLQDKLEVERRDILQIHRHELSKLVTRMEAQLRAQEEARAILAQREAGFWEQREETLTLNMATVKQERESLIGAKDALMRERLEFEEAKRLAKVELQEADASRTTLANARNQIDADANRLQQMRITIQHQTRLLLEKTTIVNKRLEQAKHLDANCAHTLEIIKAEKEQCERNSTRLKEMEARIVRASLDAMKNRRHISAAEAAGRPITRGYPTNYLL